MKLRLCCIDVAGEILLSCLQDDPDIGSLEAWNRMMMQQSCTPLLAPRFNLDQREKRSNPVSKEEDQFLDVDHNFRNPGLCNTTFQQLQKPLMIASHLSQILGCK